MKRKRNFVGGKQVAPKRKKKGWSAFQGKRLAKARANARAYRKRKLAQGFLWEKTGGGTLLIGNKHYPSDVNYRNLKTGETAYLECTLAAYLGPLRRMYWLRRLSEVTRIPGVKFRWRKTDAQMDADWEKFQRRLKRDAETAKR